MREAFLQVLEMSLPASWPARPVPPSSPGKNGSPKPAPSPARIMRSTVPRWIRLSLKPGWRSRSPISCRGARPGRPFDPEPHGLRKYISPGFAGGYVFFAAERQK